MGSVRKIARVGGTGGNVTPYWSDYGNVTADDGAFTTLATVGFDMFGDKLYGRDFGFSVPAAATLSAITAEWKGKRSDPGSVAVIEASVFDWSTGSSTKWAGLSTALTPTSTVYTAVLSSGSFPSIALVNSSDLCLFLKMSFTRSGVDVTAYIDYLALTIDYTYAGYAHTVNGVSAANIASINGIPAANIAKVKGV